MKNEILLCARETYLKHGYAGFSMRKIASCAGISATAIYRHFPDKESLMFAVLLTGFRLFLSYLKRCDIKRGPIERLQISSREYMNFALENPGYYEMMFMGTAQMTGLKNLNQNGADEMDTSYHFHHQLVVDCEFKGQDNDQLSAAIWAFGHGMVTLFLAGRLPLDRLAFTQMYETQMNNYIERL